MDEGDRGLLAARQHMKAALAAHRSKQIQGDSLMFCEDCDQPIPESRRQAMPGCTRCVSCQQKAESHA